MDKRSSEQGCIKGPVYKNDHIALMQFHGHSTGNKATNNFLLINPR